MHPLARCSVAEQHPAQRNCWAMEWGSHHLTQTRPMPILGCILSATLIPTITVLARDLFPLLDLQVGCGEECNKEGDPWPWVSVPVWLFLAQTSPFVYVRTAPGSPTHGGPVCSRLNSGLVLPGTCFWSGKVVVSQEVSSTKRTLLSRRFTWLLSYF